MERKNIYNKRRQGHARNINSFQLYRQRIKHWRFPVMLVLAVIVMFGIAPVVGEEFEASVLNSDSTRSLVSEKPEEVKKTLLNFLHSMVSDCERFYIDRCKQDGAYLIAETVSMQSNLLQQVTDVEQFAAVYAKQVAHSACKFELLNIVQKFKETMRDASRFAKQYGEDLANLGLKSQIDRVEKELGVLEKKATECAVNPSHATL